MKAFELIYRAGKDWTESKIVYWFSADTSTPCFSLYTRKAKLAAWEFVPEASLRGPSATAEALKHLTAINI